MAREVINRVQKLRKKESLQVQDDIAVFLAFQGEILTKTIEKELGMIKQAVKKPVFLMNQYQRHFKTITESDFDVDGEKLTVKVAYNSIMLKEEKIKKLDAVRLLISYYNGQ